MYEFDGNGCVFDGHAIREQEIIKTISQRGFADACQRVRLLAEKQGLAERIRRNKIMLAWARN